MDIYNCLHSSIVNCSFLNNTARSVITDSAFRGNAGGIAIGVHGNPFMGELLTFLVERCKFLGNRADPLRAPSSTDLVRFQIYTGRGGGIGIFISEDQNVQGIIQNCTFHHNFARSFGGGTYVILSGETTHHRIRISDCIYLGNEAGIGSGGAFVGYLLDATGLGTFNKVELKRCYFSGNKGYQQ